MVTVIDSATQSKVVTLPVGANCVCVDPDSIAAAPDGSRVYATDELANSVSVVDTETRSVVATIAVGTGPTAVAVSPDGTRAYVLNGSGVTSVSVIDTATNAVTATIPLGVAQARGMAVTPDGARLYVSTYGANSLKVIDTAALAVTATLPVGSLPVGVDVSPDGLFVYTAAYLSSVVNVVSTASGAVIANVAAGSNPLSARVTPDGTRLYVANLGSNTVSVVDTQTHGVVGSISVTAPRSVDFTPDGSRAYVAGSQGVHVIDTAARAVINTMTFDAATEGQPASIVVAQTSGPNSVPVLPGDPGWSAVTPPGSSVEINARNPRSGLGSLEVVRGITANPTYSGYWASGLGTFGQLDELSFEWFIDPSSEVPLPPALLVRVYPQGDPRAFFLRWNGCTATCQAFPLGSWQTTDVLNQLSIVAAAGANPPPASLDDIPPDAPIMGLRVTSGVAFGSRPWTGFVDNITIGFAGAPPTTYNFEVSSPSIMRLRPTISWVRPAPIATGTPLSAAQLNATADVPGTFTYNPAGDTTLPADAHLLGVTFVPSDPTQYLTAAKIVIQTVTGVRTVLAGEPGWFMYQPEGASVAISGANPRAGAGSLELSRQDGDNSNISHTPFPLTNRAPGQPAFGTVADLTTLSFDWFIDPANNAMLPPELALRVYDYGDPRSFYLLWAPCSQGCAPFPVGTWQTSNLIGQLTIQAADGNVPPASPDDIDPNAPIVEFQVRAGDNDGLPWHGFADNVTIAFGGQEPIVYNFEVVNAAPVAEDGAVGTLEDTAIAGQLQASDANGNPLTFSVVSNGTLGAASVDPATGAFTYTPNPNVSDDDSFTFSVSDGIATSNIATMSVTISPVNDAPVAEDGTLDVLAGDSAGGTLIATDIDSPALTYQVVTNGTKGTAIVTEPATGAFTYTANAGTSGPDTFTFTANDGAVDSNTATVTVTIAAVNEPPVAQTVAVATAQNTPFIGTLSASDAEGDAVVFTLTSAPALGQVELLDPSTGAFRYIPNPGAAGYDSFQFEVTPLGQGTAFAALTTADSADSPTTGTQMIFIVADSPQWPGETTRVSVASDGTQGNFDASGRSAVSADGRYVAFSSLASTLVPADTNGYADVFIHDRETGTTTRVSVASDGTQADRESSQPSISADGRYVAFSSLAGTLVADDTNVVSDIFVHDRHTGTTARVSVASDGTQAIGDSFEPSLSADGRYVAFRSRSRGPAVEDTTFFVDVFLHDRQTGHTRLVSIATDGSQANNDSIEPAISADGRIVAFKSYANNLVIGDSNGTWDVFVHDQQTGETTRVSVASDGTQANGESLQPSVSADGHYVAFVSLATTLVAADTNGVNDVFLHDRQTRQTTRVSMAEDGTEPNNGSLHPTLSGDGRFISFISFASNLVDADANIAPDVFGHDRQTGQTRRVSVASNGAEANGTSNEATISADGRFVAFRSYARNLAPSDTNGLSDVFVVGAALSAQEALTVTDAPASATFGTSFNVSTSGGSGTGAVTFDATGACANTAGAALITITSGTGTCAITATKAADEEYSEITSDPVFVTATKATQAPLVIIGAPPSAGIGTSFMVTTTGGSGTGAVTYSVTGVCTNSDGGPLITMTSGIGFCSISATQSADEDYETATSASVSVTATSATIILNGKVTDSESGSGIVGALVSASGGDTTLTDAAGNYSIAAQDGIPIRGGLDVRKAGYFYSTPSYDLSAGTPVTVDIPLIYGGTVLQGTVADANTGAAIANAQLHFYPGGFAMAGASGAYALDASQLSDRYASGLNVTSISVYAAGYFELQDSSGFAVNPPFPGTRNVVLVPRVGTLLQGTVTDAASHEPIAGATVSIPGGDPTLTDAAGNYVIAAQDGIPIRGGLDVRKAGYFYSTPSYDLSAGTPVTVDIPLIYGGTVLQGTVADANTGAAIANAQLHFYPGGFAMAEASGAYALDASQLSDRYASGLNVTSMSVYAAGYFELQDSSGFAVNPPFPGTRDFQLTSNGVTHTILVATLPIGLEVQVDGIAYQAPQTFVWQPSNPHTVGTTSPQPVPNAPGAQYVFTSWSDGGPIEHTIVAPSQDQTLTAVFATQYLLTTDVNPPGAGTITAGGWVNAGTQVSIQATANSAYVFTGFSGDLASTTNPQLLTMDGPKSVTANFTLAIQPQAPLFVTGAPASAVYGTSFTVSTSGGSGTGAVTFAAAGACSNTAGGALITVTSGTGTCSITATKAGDADYEEATSAPVEVAAAKAPQATLTVTGAPTDATYGTSFTVGFAGGSGTGAVTYAATGACSNTAGGALITMTSGSGTCSIEATKATDADFLEATSTPALVTALPTSPPAAPSGLTAIGSSANQIALAWIDNAATEDGFKIERSQTNQNNFVQIATVGADVTGYVDAGLNAATRYYYRVRAFAVNSSGDSAYSNTANATTLSAPAVPSSLTATAVSGTQIDLVWADRSNNETGFKVWRSMDGSTFIQIATLSQNVTSYADIGLTAETTYYYQVQAYNATGDSAYSNSASATTLSPGPAAPTGLTATGVSGSQINLAWTDNASDEAGFRIERSSDGTTFVEVAVVGADVTSYGDTNLARLTRYYYRVRAYNAVGNSGYSNTATDRTRR